MRSFFKAIGAAIVMGGLHAGSIHADPPAETRGLADAMDEYFLVGAALAPVHYEGAQAQIVRQHFNAVVAENYMKPVFLQPQEGVFDWQEADRFVAFGEAHGMHMTGHTLA